MSYGIRITRRAVLVCLAFYWLLLAAGTHLPGSKMPAIGMGDKTLHLGAFAGLAYLLSWCVQRWRPTIRRAGWILVVLMVYAAIDELTQGLVPHRQPDWADWQADVLGAALGIFAQAASVWAWWKMRPPAPTQSPWPAVGAPVNEAA